MKGTRKNWNEVKQVLWPYVENKSKLTKKMFKRDTAPLLGLKVKMYGVPEFQVEAILVCTDAYSKRRLNRVHVMGIVVDPKWPHTSYTGFTMAYDDVDDILEKTVVEWLTTDEDLDVFKIVSEKMTASLVARELEA